ncbi:MAG: universal stress protein [Thermomicrobiales bacterium]
MPKTIVVPLDESENGERALPIAVTLARQLDAQLLLVSIYEVHPEYAQWARDYTRETEAYLARIASRLRPLTVSTLVLTGIDPAVEIDDAVSRMDDVILVMSTLGRSGLKRLVLGSKTTRVIQLASYPVVVVPVECEDYTSPVSRILIPLDGSTFAEYALHVTRELFAETNPALDLLRVVDEVWVETHVDVELQQELMDEAKHYLSQIGEGLRADGVDTGWGFQKSLDIANTIVTIARHADANMIAIATHGRSGFSRFFLGSVADAVLRTSTVPVLVIRPTEEIVKQAPEVRAASHGED